MAGGKKNHPYKKERAHRIITLRKEAREKKKKDAGISPEQQPAEKSIPKTLESKRVFDPSQVMDAETLTEMDANDEFSDFFTKGLESKVFISTTRRAHIPTFKFAEEIADIFPNATYKKRTPDMFVEDIVKGAIERSYTHLIIVNESRKVTDTLTVTKLPEGPTIQFQLTSIKLSKQIHNHGRSSSHTPELILKNFVTKLGHRVGRCFISMFPHIPQFHGRQVVTFHNQRDFIFVRRHRYVFEGTERVRMQEIGPQFTLKVKKIIRATHHLQNADVEYEWKPHAVDNKKFAI